MTNKTAYTPVSPTIRLTTWVLVGLFATIVGGSYLATSEIVARGQGKIVPAIRVQLVQPQVDGKISAIRAKEGEPVRAGDILVQMDETAALSEIARVQVAIDRSSQETAVAASIVEPLSERNPSDPGFIEAGIEALSRRTAGSLEGRTETEEVIVTVLKALSDQVAEIDARINQLKAARDAQLIRVGKAKADRELVSRRLASTNALRQQGAVSELDHIEQLREFNATDSDATIAEWRLREMSAELDATTKQRTSTISGVRSTYRKQLADAEIALRGSRAELTAAQTHLRNLTLRAPVDGKVEGLSVFTLGGFIEAGATMMSIVPSGSDLEIEAFFDNRDIGFLEAGQRAFIKFDAFPAERFGIISGRVLSVGADAREDASTHKWIYAVRLELDRHAIRVGNRSITFSPGMTATVDVITGERRLIAYFFEPILKILQDSFGER